MEMPHLDRASTFWFCFLNTCWKEMSAKEGRSDLVVSIQLTKRGEKWPNCLHLINQEGDLKSIGPLNPLDDCQCISNNKNLVNCQPKGTLQHPQRANNSALQLELAPPYQQKTIHLWRDDPDMNTTSTLTPEEAPSKNPTENLSFKSKKETDRKWDLEDQRAISKK